MAAPLEMVTFATSHIYSMVYLIDITYINKIKSVKLNFLYKLISCEAQEGAELTMFFYLFLIGLGGCSSADILLTGTRIWCITGTVKLQ